MFAQNSLSKYIIQDIILYTSRSWVKEALGPSLKKFMSMKKNLSPDPRTNAMSDETRVKLGDILKECVTDLLKSGEAMPVELKRILIFAKKKMDRKWPPQNDAVSLTNVIVFLFAHVVIPATAQPQVWGISKEAHTSESGRTSIVLNKLFRNIASGGQFEASSPLAAFNLTIKKLQPKLKDFTELLVNERLTADDGAPLPTLKPSDPQPSETISVAFQTLHHCLYLWKDAILEYRNSLTGVPVAEARIFFDMMGILEELELIEGKPECPPDFTAIQLDKTTKPPAKATMRRPTPAMLNSGTPSSAAATSSAAASGGKPYVRQLSEKWNREHQLRTMEAKKTEQAAEQRKAMRDEEKRGREKSASVAPAMVRSSPSTPTKPHKGGDAHHQPDAPASASAAGRSNSGSSTGSGRSSMQRAYTTDPIKLDLSGGHDDSSSSDNPTPTNPSGGHGSTKLHLDAVAEGDELTSPSSTARSKSSSETENHDGVSPPSPSTISSTAGGHYFEKHASDNSTLSTRTSSRSVNSETSVSFSDNFGDKSSLNNSDAEVTPSNNTGKDGGYSSSAGEGSKDSPKAAGKNRKSKKFSPNMLEGMHTAGDASSGEQVASPGMKRRKKVDGRTPSDSANSSPNTKIKRAKSKIKPSSEDESSPTPTGAAGVPALVGVAAIVSPQNRSPLRVHREVMTIGDGDERSDEGASSPKLTIVSLKPNPSLNQLENTPVSPRAAEFLRERSNSVSSPSTQKQAKKADKALEMLGITAGGASETRSATSMAQVVRELGVANATLQRELETANQKREQLERDIARLQELHDARSSRISEFHSKLTSSILYKRNKANHIRRLTMHSKRTFNASLDDNLFDFQSASLPDRRAVLASTIFARAQDNPSLRAAPMPSSSSSSLASASHASSRNGSKHNLHPSSSKHSESGTTTTATSKTERRDSLDTSESESDHGRSGSTPTVSTNKKERTNLSPSPSETRVH